MTSPNPFPKPTPDYHYSIIEISPINQPYTGGLITNWNFFDQREMKENLEELVRAIEGHVLVSSASIRHRTYICEFCKQSYMIGTDLTWDDMIWRRCCQNHPNDPYYDEEEQAS